MIHTHFRHIYTRIGEGEAGHTHRTASDSIGPHAYRPTGKLSSKHSQRIVNLTLLAISKELAKGVRITNVVVPMSNAERNKKRIRTLDDVVRCGHFSGRVGGVLNKQLQGPNGRKVINCNMVNMCVSAFRRPRVGVCLIRRGMTMAYSRCAQKLAANISSVCKHTHTGIYTVLL